MGAWHDEMAAAVNKRQLALNGVNRWNKKLAAADAVILQLSAARPVPGGVPAPEEIAVEVPQNVPGSLNPVFGISAEISQGAE